MPNRLIYKAVKTSYIIVFYTLMLVPVFAVVVLSFSKSSYLEFPPTSLTFNWYGAIFSDSKWVSSLKLSLLVAMVVAFLSTILSLFFVVGSANLKKRIKVAIMGAFFLPVLTPAIVIGVALFFWFSKWNIIDTPLSLVLAHTLISFPLAVWILDDANNAISKKLDNTARTLGAGFFEILLKIKLPLLYRSLIICLILTFIISFDEPVISLFISGTRNVTLPKAMWDGIRYEINPSILAIASLIICFTTILTCITIFIYKPNNNT